MEEVHLRRHQDNREEEPNLIYKVILEKKEKIIRKLNKI